MLAMQYHRLAGRTTSSACQGVVFLFRSGVFDADPGIWESSQNKRPDTFLRRGVFKTITLLDRIFGQLFGYKFRLTNRQRHDCQRRIFGCACCELAAI